MKRYDPASIEPKWQDIWQQDGRYHAADFSNKKKYYVTGMFPYPSGAGMHTGHFFEHSIVDAVARFRRALGYEVLYPMGWDSFGLPAENYAIKTGKIPQETTAENIANFKNQLTRVGASIDWNREINTTDPGYYKWTQWIFTQLFDRGLAYQKEAMQWWCPKDKTVLANEQVIDGKCWRCESVVEKKAMKQWFFKITDYADALLEELPDLNWPNKIKVAQENWIGRSEGAEVEFMIDGRNEAITVFTTRPDTLFGATFLVLAPEHALAKSLVNDDTQKMVLAYIDQAVKKSEIERQSEGKEKTGVFSGSYAINPATGQKVPIWIADYVLGGYGTGAIMAVPAHDERDLAFATKFKLPVIQVIAPYYVAGGAGTPHNDVETLRRETVDAIIVDQEGNYLLEVEGEQSHFVGGGIDDGESVENALRRKILEETGYSNIVSIKQAAPYASGLGYRHTKNKNQLTWGAFYEVIIDSSVQVANESDAGKHKLIWVTKGEVEKNITPSWEHHVNAWHKYLSEEDTKVFSSEGLMVNSGAFDGMESAEAREEIVAWLEQQGLGKSKVTYKMRDWLISRQRYWGAPIPIIHCRECGVVPVPKEDLPVLLPDVEDFAPRGDGKSVLAAQEDWANVTCPECGGDAKRETDTMDGYACSSWYLLRYTDPNDTEEAFKRDIVDYWAPLDMYVGGDHAVAHLLYVRFWTHVFNDMGLTGFKEPVHQLVYHGLIQAEDGRKMSKSLGNVVDPLEVIAQGYGADALRTFELFLGPINENSSWSSRGITGVYRFLNRVWTLAQEYMESSKDGKADIKALESATHATIKKVTDDIGRLSFNTAISALMEFTNELYKLKTAGYSQDWQFTVESLVKMIQPFAPHAAAELWEQLGHSDQLDFVAWPEWDDAKIARDTVTIVVQVNGKVRGTVDVPASADQATVTSTARADKNVAKHVDGKQTVKEIYVPGKILNIVVK